MGRVDKALQMTLPSLKTRLNAVHLPRALGSLQLHIHQAEANFVAMYRCSFLCGGAASALGLVPHTRIRRFIFPFVSSSASD
eukprot:335011-Pleurochrysis_carterae.AAC.1